MKISPIVLGSQSPQRRALLASIVAPERLQILPPTDSEESGFEGLVDTASIQQRLFEITRTKSLNVRNQLKGKPWEMLLTADTVIVSASSGVARVLGKPDGPGWKETVREWFLQEYSGRTHQVMTAVSLQFADDSEKNFCETTSVTFREISPALLEWYLETNEPLGKAGGYGIQGLGNLFVESISGSFSNIVGLPLEPIWQHLRNRSLV